MMDRYDGQAERVLAAYNAGPHRVDAWTASRPDIPAEEFVESIPFTETRYYVMSVLAAREHYQRLYGLEMAPRTSSPVAGGGRPRAFASGTSNSRPTPRSLNPEHRPPPPTDPLPAT